MTLELDEFRPRSWRRPTLAACGLTAMLVAVALTWASGLDYARSAPQLFRARPV